MTWMPSEPYLLLLLSNFTLRVIDVDMVNSEYNTYPEGSKGRKIQPKHEESDILYKFEVEGKDPIRDFFLDLKLYFFYIPI
jgi:hypothetical protein